MRFASLLFLAALSGCATHPASPLQRPRRGAAEHGELAEQADLPDDARSKRAATSPYIHQAEPDLRKRIAAIGRQNIGQPYMLNLLGEFPYQLHDTLPMFSLDHSDCVVFAEHTYAMALSQSWEEFFWMLQRIRYKDGVVGVATRNHYTEVDWNINNNWLVTDISAQLAGADGPSYGLTVDRARFLKTRHQTDSSLPVQTSREVFRAGRAGRRGRRPVAGRRFRQRDLDPQRRVLGLARRAGGDRRRRPAQLPQLGRAAGARRIVRRLRRPHPRPRGSATPAPASPARSWPASNSCA